MLLNLFIYIFLHWKFMELSLMTFLDYSLRFFGTIHQTANISPRPMFKPTFPWLHWRPYNFRLTCNASLVRTVRKYSKMSIKGIIWNIYRPTFSRLSQKQKTEYNFIKVLQIHKAPWITHLFTLSFFNFFSNDSIHALKVYPPFKLQKWRLRGTHITISTFCNSVFLIFALELCRNPRDCKQVISQLGNWHISILWIQLLLYCCVLQ